MITQVWDCSEPDWAGSTAVKFLGVEVRRTPSGAFHLSQETFLLDLLQKYPQIEYPAPTPVILVTVEAEAAVTAEDVRAAQGIAGKLTWLVCRTRPDIAFATKQLKSFPNLYVGPLLLP